MHSSQYLNILMTVDSAAQFLTMKDFADGLKRVSDETSFVMYFTGSYELMDKHAEASKKSGFHVFLPQSFKADNAGLPLDHTGTLKYKLLVKYSLFLDDLAVSVEGTFIKPCLRFTRKIINKLEKVILLLDVTGGYKKLKGIWEDIFKYEILCFRTAKKFANEISHFEKIIEDLGINIVVTPKDSIFYMNKTIVAASKNKNIPSVLLPFDEASTSQLFDDRASDERHLVVNVKDKLLFKKYPQWFFKKKDKIVCIIDKWDIPAFEKYGFRPHDPWVYNSSLSDVILLDSEQRRDKYLENGFNFEQLKVCGWPYQDKLYQSEDAKAELRSKINKKYGFDDQLPLFLLSLPPDKFKQYGHRTPYKNYEELIAEWAGVFLENKKINCLITLHPNTKAETVKKILGDGKNIIDARTYEIMPICDVYVVDCSSTSLWAISLGKLVIDFDIYKFDFKYHSDKKGITHVFSKSQAKKATDTYLSNGYEAVSKDLIAKSKLNKYGIIDGLASERIFKELIKLIDTKKQA